MTALSQLHALPFEQPHPLAVAPRLRELQAQGAVHKVRTPEVTSAG